MCSQGSFRGPLLDIVCFGHFEPDDCPLTSWICAPIDKPCCGPFAGFNSLDECNGDDSSCDGLVVSQCWNRSGVGQIFGPVAPANVLDCSSAVFHSENDDVGRSSAHSSGELGSVSSSHTLSRQQLCSGFQMWPAIAKFLFLNAAGRLAKNRDSAKPAGKPLHLHLE